MAPGQYFVRKNQFVLEAEREEAKIVKISSNFSNLWDSIHHRSNLHNVLWKRSV